MNEHREPDPLDALRAANPVDDDQLPSASLARIRARVREDVMDTNTRPARGSARLLGAGVGAAALAAFALVVLLRPGVAPATDPVNSGGPISASCVEQYSTATLANRDFAFDGTVTEISGEKVTFTVGTALRAPTVSQSPLMCRA